MNKLKFYKLIILGLIIINALLISMFLLRKPGKRPTPRKIIIERLQFSESQIESYDELIRVHKSNVGKTHKEIGKLKNALYKQLNEKIQNATILDSLKDELSLAQRNMENVHYDHFLDIKKLCKTDQKAKYKELSKDIAKLFSPKRGKHKKNK